MDSSNQTRNVKSQKVVDTSMDEQSRIIDQNIRSSATNTGNVGGIGGDISVGGGNTLQDTENWSNPEGGKNIDE